MQHLILKMKKIQRRFYIFVFRIYQIFTKHSNHFLSSSTYKLVKEFADEVCCGTFCIRACACTCTNIYVGIRCMPAGVIDITKYAMADRSQLVLVRTTTALPTLPRIQLHPSRTLRKILGKSCPRVSACRRKIDFSLYCRCQ